MKGSGWLLRVTSVVAAFVAVAGVGVPGCSSSFVGAALCNEAPWQCGSGSTCWPTCECPSGQSPCTTANCTTQFSCIASKSDAVVGENCSLKNGVAQCGDNETCVAIADAGAGICEAYCDQNQGCAPGYTCTVLRVTGAGSSSERVCLPPALASDGGFDIDTGLGGSSGGESDASSEIGSVPDVLNQLMDGATNKM